MQAAMLAFNCAAMEDTAASEAYRLSGGVGKGKNAVYIYMIF
jgi:hypothetical protein